MVLSLAEVDLILICGNFCFYGLPIPIYHNPIYLNPITIYIWLPSSVMHMRATIDAEAKLATTVGFPVGRNYIWWVLDSVCPMMF